MKVLVVCLGNICRSPLAEGILKSKVEGKGLDWEVDSAGMGGWHEGELPDHRAISVAESHGIDIKNQRARKIQKEDFDKFDLVLPMDTSNRDDLHEMASKREQRDKVRLIMDVLYPNKNISVPDPYFGGDDGFERVFQMLDEACEKIVEVYSKP
jgi:protein-tyrosine phosphatase